MMRSNFSRLAVLGLTAISGQVFAAVSLSGQLRLDTNFVSEPDGTADSMDLSRVRLNVKGDVSSDWMAGVRLEGASGSVDLQRAYASWMGLENTTVTLGKTSHIATDADYFYYAPYTMKHGALAGFSGMNEVGASVAGSMGAFGYKLGLVNSATTDDTPATGDSLKWSMGARAHFTAMNSDKMSWGLGLGLVSRKHADKHVDYTDSTAQGFARFDKNSGMTLDMSGVMGCFALTGGIYTMKDKLNGVFDAKTDTTATANSQTNNPFAKDGKSNSYYVEGVYLVMGNGYGFKDAVVAGPKFKSSALELGVRLSHKTQNNAAALLDNASTLSFYADGAGTVADTFAANDDYKVKTNATSLFANYHVNSNAVIKVEYYNAKAKTEQNINQSTETAEVAKFADAKNKHISIRAQFSF